MGAAGSGALSRTSGIGHAAQGDDVGEPGTIGENVLRNEREVTEQARALGLEREWIGNKVRAISFLFTPDGASTGTGKETSDVTTTPV